MKTPEEIKKGLECCNEQMNCDECPYHGEADCSYLVLKDGLSYIKSLELDIAERDELCEFLRDKAMQLDAQVPRWISVEERLPEHWHLDDKERTLINYLVYSPDYGVDVGNYIKPAKRWVCMGLPMSVTHWMPLPEPPKEGK